MKPVVRYVITDIFMGMSHNGLQAVIDAHKKQNALFARVIKSPGSLVLFLNVSRTAAKLFAPNGDVVGYLRMRSKLTARMIDRIPEAFGGSVEYS